MAEEETDGVLTREMIEKAERDMRGMLRPAPPHVEESVRAHIEHIMRQRERELIRLGRLRKPR